MKLIQIDNKMFGYHICPRYDKVFAEIYYIDKKTDLEIQVLSKEFGSIWRKPNKHDYVLAEMWCNSQLDYIKEANK